MFVTISFRHDKGGVEFLKNPVSRPMHIDLMYISLFPGNLIDYILFIILKPLRFIATGVPDKIFEIPGA